MLGQLEKNIRQIARLVGEPVKFDIQVNKGVFEIIAVDKLEEFDEGSDAPAININKKIKIKDVLRYIG